MDICTEKDEGRRIGGGKESEHSRNEKRTGKPVRGRQKTEVEDSWRWVRPAIMRRGWRIGEEGGYGSEEEETEEVTIGGDRGGGVDDEAGSEEGGNERNGGGQERGNVKEGGNGARKGRKDTNESADGSTLEMDDRREGATLGTTVMKAPPTTTAPHRM